MYADLIDQWLEAKHCTMWANWNIQDPDQRRQAGIWFRNQMMELDEFESSKYLGVDWDVVR